MERCRRCRLSGWTTECKVLDPNRSNSKILRFAKRTKCEFGRQSVRWVRSLNGKCYRYCHGSGGATAWLSTFPCSVCVGRSPIRSSYYLVATIGWYRTKWPKRNRSQLKTRTQALRLGEADAGWDKIHTHRSGISPPLIDDMWPKWR